MFVCKLLQLFAEKKKLDRLKALLKQISTINVGSNMGVIREHLVAVAFPRAVGWVKDFPCKTWLTISMENPAFLSLEVLSAKSN